MCLKCSCSDCFVTTIVCHIQCLVFSAGTSHVWGVSVSSLVLLRKKQQWASVQFSLRSLLIYFPPMSLYGLLILKPCTVSAVFVEIENAMRNKCHSWITVYIFFSMHFFSNTNVFKIIYHLLFFLLLKIFW